MPKRAHSYRARPSTYIPYGKPEETARLSRIETVSKDTADLLGTIHSLTKSVAVYTTESESLQGFSTDSRTANDTRVLTGYDRVKGQHQRTCDLASVKLLWFRGGRAWCTSCYSTRWGVHPLDDPHREQAPPNWTRQTRAERSGSRN
jgi:hypothetical protein